MKRQDIGTTRPSGLLWSLVLLFGIIFATGCGSEKLARCTPDEAEPCVCPGGLEGTQVCSEEGRFARCECIGESPDAGISDGGMVSDVGSGEEDAFTTDPDRSNLCGGAADLGAHEPAQTCGECDEGTWVCDGRDGVRCAGARAKNACGQCRPLRHAVGDLCGPCGQGQWACSESGDLLCVGDLPLNACGGCAPLTEQRGFVCEVGGSPGTWECTGRNELVCVGPNRNLCGGTSSLAGVPGAACGRCSGGRWLCAGNNHVICDAPEAEVNACGGCAPLDAEPGQDCGECGGLWECDGIERLRCSEPLNLCGSCSSLAAQPGQSCGQGRIFACDGSDDIACRSTLDANACGGFFPLVARPGTPCGPCLDGTYICASSEQVVCIGSELQPNACGGCGNLQGEPDTTCGLDQAWRCQASGERVQCTFFGENTCGGTLPLEGTPGTACQTCGVWQCDPSDVNAAICVGGSLGSDDDFENCGACGRRCAPGQTCRQGQCIDDPVVSIAASRDHTCARRQSGRVWCWGDGSDGALGTGDRRHRRRPTQMSGLDDALELAVGDSFTCVNRAAGEVACSGSNSERRISSTGIGLRRELLEDIEELRGLRAISAGRGFSCGIDADGRAVCWGENRRGQLGRGTATNSEGPGWVEGLEDVQKVVVTSDHLVVYFAGAPLPPPVFQRACAIGSGGRVWCWGSFIAGRGHSLSEGTAPLPLEVPGLSDVVDLGITRDRACALLGNGEHWCWVLDGLVIDEETNERALVPEQVVDVEQPTAVFGGNLLNCATPAAGGLWCYGRAFAGMAGDGTSGTRFIRSWQPMPFFEGKRVIDMSATYRNVCVLIDTGKVYCSGGGMSLVSRSTAPLLGDNQLPGSSMSRSFFNEVVDLAHPDSEVGLCRDDRDNDGDGRPDCADADCAFDLGGRVPLYHSGFFIGREGNYFQGSCGLSNGREHVFTWTAPSTETFVMSTRGSTLPTVLYVLTSCSESATDAELACDVSSASDGRSLLTLDAEQGRTYVIVVDSPAGVDPQGYLLSIDRP